MRFMYLWVLAAAALLGGCAGNPMQVSPTQTLPAAGPESAQVVFMRSSFVGKMIDASLYDVTGGQTKYIGIMANGSKVNYPTTPGKTYYSLVTPRMGAWKARFSLWPISNDPKAEYTTTGTDFAGWVKDTELVGNSPRSLAWFENNKSSVEEKRAEYWKVWQQKSAEDLAKRTLHPQDGL